MLKYQYRGLTLEIRERLTLSQITISACTVTFAGYTPFLDALISLIIFPRSGVSVCVLRVRNVYLANVPVRVIFLMI